MIQFHLGKDVQKATRRRPRQGRPDPQRSCRARSTRRSSTASTSTTSRSSPTRSPRRALSDADLSWFVDNTSPARCRPLPGVGQVNRVGGVDREINVIIDPARMAAQGVTAPQINHALAQVNVDVARRARQRRRARADAARAGRGARPSTRSATSPCRPPAAASSGFRTSPMSATARPRSAPSRCSTAGRWSASR